MIENFILWGGTGVLYNLWVSMTLWYSFILGIVQGVTEFLPISSSAHLRIIPWFWDLEDPGLSFSVFLHVGTLVAIGVYFAKDWWRIGKAGIQSVIEMKLGYDHNRWMFWYVGLATLPAVFVGLTLHELAETAFRSPLIIAVALAVVGFFLYWIDGRSPSIRTLDELGLKDALVIGLAQALAIVPGVSRSGATMTLARLLGFKREVAARFSFLLSFPIILGAGLYEGYQFFGDTGPKINTAVLFTGFLSSAVFGWLSIHFLLSYLRTADFQIFAWYRMGLALVVLIWTLV